MVFILIWLGIGLVAGCLCSFISYKRWGTFGGADVFAIMFTTLAGPPGAIGSIAAMVMTRGLSHAKVRY